MKVTIGVAGRWRAFRLAEQLKRHGCLRKIITSYPFWAVSHEGVDRDAVVSLPIVEIFGRALGRVPVLRNVLPVDYWKMTLFDALARRHVADCDVFVGWAAFARRSVKEAKRRGAVTFIERESSHIVYSERLLEEEYQRCGAPVRRTDPRVVNLCLEEYEVADYIVVPSEFAYRSFVSQGFEPTRLVKMPSGVDLTSFRPVAKDDDVFRVLFVGGLNLRKGVQYLLEAVTQLPRRGVEVLLVGSISNEIVPYLTRYRDVFRYGGIVPNAELYKVYSQASVFVLPSIEDGWGYVIGEAMACGLPVVATTNSGGSEIVREGVDGYIVPIRDPDAIAKRLLALYENPERSRAMGRAARERAHTFTWERYGAQALGVYRAALDGLVGRAVSPR